MLALHSRQPRQHSPMLTQVNSQQPTQKASFESYQSELSGIDQQLASQQGSPDTHTVQHLLNLYKTAMQAINQPCLEATCDWHAQVSALNQASNAFLKAGGQ